MTFKILAAGLMPAALTACAAATPLPDTSYLTAPAALSVAPRTTGYADPLRGYTARPVTDPGDWRELNRSQEGS